MFTVGQYVVVKQSFANNQLAERTSTPFLQRTLETLGLLGGTQAVSQITAIGVAQQEETIFQTISLLPIDQFSPLYHGGAGVTVYFDSLADMQDSFELSVAFLEEVQQARVYNNSGSSITRGQVVYFTGFNIPKQLPTIALASASLTNSSFVIGLADSDIANNSAGSVTTVGPFTRLDTSGFSQLNQIVFLSNSPGAISVTAGTNSVTVGRVMSLDAINGSIFIFGVYTGAGGGGGSQGTTGIQGTTGLTGLTGIEGLTGIQGTTGIIGINGQTGIEGLTGIQGFTGIQGPGAFQTVIARTMDTTLSLSDANVINTNTGDGIDIAITLPALALGYSFYFSVTAAHYIRINNLDGSTTINLGTTTSAAGGFVRSNVPGAQLRITAVSSTQWFAVVTGDWTVDS